MLKKEWIVKVSGLLFYTDMVWTYGNLGYVQKWDISKVWLNINLTFRGITFVQQHPLLNFLVQQETGLWTSPPSFQLSMDQREAGLVVDVSSCPVSRICIGQPPDPVPVKRKLPDSFDENKNFTDLEDVSDAEPAETRCTTEDCQGPVTHDCHQHLQGVLRHRWRAGRTWSLIIS